MRWSPPQKVPLSPQPPHHGRMWPGAQSTPKTLSGHKSGPLGRITTIFGATKMYFRIAEAYAGATESPEMSLVVI